MVAAGGRSDEELLSVTRGASDAGSITKIGRSGFGAVVHHLPSPRHLRFVMVGLL